MVGAFLATMRPAEMEFNKSYGKTLMVFGKGQMGSALGSFLIRHQRGHPDVVLPLVIYNSANH